MLRDKFKKLKPVQLIALGYLLIVNLGATLLMLPISSAEGRFTPYNETLLTATSATCVTGLIVHDTATYWTLFGQLVILSLIQIGGLGFMTITISALSMTHRKIGLRQRLVMQEAIAGQQVGGIVRMGRFIFLSAFVVELVGALLLSFRFIPMFGWARGIYYSVFHAVSAFCNAGFDLMGTPDAKFVSLTGFSSDPYVCFIIMGLIVVGGLGFFVWAEVLNKRTHLRKFSLHSKLVLSVTAFLLITGTVGFFFFEWNNPAMGDNWWERLLSAAFQSVTARTAGFNTIDLTTMSDPSQLLMCALMLIGGSPGSTAGGMKTTTVVILALSVLAELRARKSIECFRRRIDDHMLRQACCIAVLYLGICVAGGVAISVFDGIPLDYSLYETSSAVGTVGLTLGVTPHLSVPSQLIVSLLMYIGRVGGFTFLLLFANRSSFTQSQLPLEKINVG